MVRGIEEDGSRKRRNQQSKPVLPIRKKPRKKRIRAKVPTGLERTFKDDVDISCHPSYTNFELPYEAVCRQRYNRAVKEYNRQFRQELKKVEAMQPSAYEALRFNRIFSITTLWPPLHTKKEVDYVLHNFYKMSPKQQSRLNYLMKEEQI